MNLQFVGWRILLQVPSTFQPTAAYQFYSASMTCDFRDRIIISSKKKIGSIRSLNWKRMRISERICETILLTVSMLTLGSPSPLAPFVRGAYKNKSSITGPSPQAKSTRSTLYQSRASWSPNALSTAPQPERAITVDLLNRTLLTSTYTTPQYGRGVASTKSQQSEQKMTNVTSKSKHTTPSTPQYERTVRNKVTSSQLTSVLPFEGKDDVTTSSRYTTSTSPSWPERAVRVNTTSSSFSTPSFEPQPNHLPSSYASSTTKLVSYFDHKTNVTEPNKGYSTTSVSSIPYNVSSNQQTSTDEVLDSRDRGLKVNQATYNSSAVPNRQPGMISNQKNDFTFSSGPTSLVDDKTPTSSTVNDNGVVFLNRNKGTTSSSTVNVLWNGLSEAPTTRTSSSTSTSVNVLWNGLSGIPSTSTTTRTSSSTSTSVNVLWNGLSETPSTSTTTIRPFTFSTPKSINIEKIVNGTTEKNLIDFKEVIAAPEFKCPDDQKRDDSGKCVDIY